MIDESQVRTRAFQLWDRRGRQPGLFDACLEQARGLVEEEARLDALAAGKATAPPPSQTRPGQLFQDPNEERAEIDRRGRDIEADTDQPLLRTETQGAPVGQSK